jgi:hypothetical protein
MLQRCVLLLAVIAASACGVPTTFQAATATGTASAANSVQHSESAPAIPDLTALTRLANLVVVGRIASPGTTRQVSSGGSGISFPVTTYSVDVERVVRGAPPPGTQIVLAQSGNPIAGAPPSADDPPLTAGERDVLFLQRADDGTYFLVGGPQGRLTIDAQGNVHTVGAGSPATRGRDGQMLDAFLNDVLTVK